MQQLIPLLDSRKVINPTDSLFFAIDGENHDGHKYVDELYAKGVRNFVIEKPFETQKYPNASFKIVESTVHELQLQATQHKNQFDIPTVGITGSNGKTIVKEWLSEMLEPEEIVVKSPRSYNSQIGVPLSVFGIREFHTFGIFEAGISKKDEMSKLEKIIAPTYGIITNIGSAHDAGFENQSEKIKEKLTLFKHSKFVIYHKKNNLLHDCIQQEPSNTISWSFTEKANYLVQLNHKSLQINAYTFEVHFLDNASLENLIHCIVFLLEYGFSEKLIQQKVNKLRPISMRLEVKKAKNNCYLIDDSYNNDVDGLQIALEFLNQNKQRKNKTIILSDVLQSGLSDEQLYTEINQLLLSKDINRVIAIGNTITQFASFFDVQNIITFKNTVHFLNAVVPFKDEIILVKGARNFEFEKIVKKLEFQQHRTVMEINLNALVNNLNFYRSYLKPETKIMVMVKAFAYGGGSFEIANLLQFQQVNYLAVAYADEGVELRKNGIQTPIMVMNPSDEDFDNILTYQLEPEIYSINLLESWLEFVNQKQKLLKIHIKIDSGMHRLGFESTEELIKKIRCSNQKVEIASIFSHLATADKDSESAFVFEQIKKFKTLSNQIENQLQIDTLKHILNSSGITNYPEMQMDMVRLGIGLYGVEPTDKHKEHIQTVASLKSVISQLKNVSTGDSVGYSRNNILEKNSKIATIAIGYADGVNRKLSKGVGNVFINGKLAPIVGNVCMDMLMADVSDIDCQENDEVEIFGNNIDIKTLANQLKTISYEILTSVSERVKRVYFQE